MICQACGTQNRAGRRFCVNCGATLLLACPSCGAAYEPGERFCGDCGTPLPGAAAGPAGGPALTSAATSGPGAAPGNPVTAAARATPVAERRLVSILFADLVGFTSYAADRDPEEVRELLTRYFDLAREIVERYGGVVEKFIGDAVMAVWGTPTAQEDDAERAVRAGMELIDAIPGLGPGMQARCGVLTGEAAVTIGAVGQGMVAGDIVNTASRLQSVAPTGTVLVGEATRRAASGAIVFEEAGEQLLKGKASPVPAFRALRVVAERGGRNRSETLEAPFVGRSDELRLLKDLFHATGRESRARLVSVVGPAGIGKSRLSWEFLKYVDGLLETVWWHQGRSPAYGEGISFWALGEMVRARCGLLEQEDEPTIRRKVAATVAEHVVGEEDQRWIERSLLTLLGVESGMPPAQLFAAWRTFFEALARTGTVAMVFEDLHFADPGLLDFIDHLLEWSRGSAIYVLTLARPELLDKRPDWGAGKRHFTSVYLEPLPEPAMRELLAGLVPGLPDSAVRRIIERAGGVPLYAVETVRMLVAEGRLELREDRYVPVGDLDDLAVPETLTALIAARLDALDPVDRGIVQHAAVLGQSFTLGALAAVSGVTTADLEPRLRALVRRELLTVEADPRSPERGQYAFVQALIREVAYNTLAHRDRKERHLAAARYFESLGSDELAGALAGHYLAARANATPGPEADALAGQARIALRAAGDRAAKLGAYVQAEGYFTQAASVATGPADEAELLEKAGDAALTAARPPQAEALFLQALEARRRADDRRATAMAVAQLGRVFAQQYDVIRGVALLDPALVEFADLGPGPELVALELALAGVLHTSERFVEALPHADRAMEMAERIDDPSVITEALARRGAVLHGLGRLYESQALLRGALAMAEAMGLTGEELRVRGSLIITLTQVDPAEGLRVARAALEQAGRLGYRNRLIHALGNGAELARQTGDWDWSLAQLREVLAGEMGDEARVWLLSQVGIIQAWRGEDHRAVEREMRALLATIGDGENRTVTLDLRTLEMLAADAAGRWADEREIALELAVTSPLNIVASLNQAVHADVMARDLEAARADLAAHIAIGPRGGFVRTRRAIFGAGVAALEGRTAEALAGYSGAIRELREMGLPVEAAFVAMEMLSVLDPAEPAVAAAATMARETFSRLGAVPYVARIEALLAGGAGERAAAAPSGTGASPNKG
ncbi:MAG: adenylate/guanylate cyclase domain-containing protein [Chloroflexota bacterium]